MRLLDNGSLLMTQREVDDLLEYSMSLPTGTKAGKSWKRRVPWNAPKERAHWVRGTYGLPYPDGHRYAGQVPIGWRPIVIEGRSSFLPHDVRVPLPPMRGRITAVPVRQARPVPAPADDLPDGLFLEGGRVMFTCEVCGAATELPVDVAEYDSDGINLCGGSPRCLP